MLSQLVDPVFGRYAVLLSVIAGVLELVPIIGPIIAAVPAVLLAATAGLEPVIAALVLYTLVQQVENNLLVPKIQGDAVELHPAAVIFAIIIGGSLAGLLGAILALPVTAAVRDVVRYLFRRLSPDAPGGPRRVARGPRARDARGRAGRGDTPPGDGPAAERAGPVQGPPGRLRRPRTRSSWPPIDGSRASTTPTRRPGAEAAARMAAINAAWEVLGDPTRRAAYDRSEPSRRRSARRGATTAAQRRRRRRGRRAHAAAACGDAGAAPADRAHRRATGPEPSRATGRAAARRSAAATTRRCARPTAPAPPARRPGNPSGSVLNFGRYAGWSLGEIAAARPRVPRVARPDADRPAVSRRDRRDPAAARAAALGRGRDERPPRALPPALSSGDCLARRRARRDRAAAIGPSGPKPSQAIELFVALLGVAGLVAIVARPLRLPYTVALVAVGLVIGGLAGPIGLEGGRSGHARARARWSSCPGLVFEAAYRLRLARAAAMVLGARAPRRARRADLGGRRGRSSCTWRPAPRRSRVPRRRDGLRDRPGGRRGDLQAARGLAIAGDAGRRREPAQRRHGPGAVRDRGPGGRPSPSARRMRSLSFVAAIVISAAIGLAAGLARGPAGRGRERPPDRAHDLGRRWPTAPTWSRTSFHLSGVIATVAAGGRPRQLRAGARLDARPARDAIDTVWEFLAYVLTAVVVPARRAGDPAGAPARRAACRSRGRSSAMLVGRALIVYVLLGAASRLAPLPGLAARGAAGRGCTSCSGRVCAGRSRWRWRWRCRSTCRSGRCSQDITFGAVLFTLARPGDDHRAGRRARSGRSADAADRRPRVHAAGRQSDVTGVASTTPRVSGGC